MAKTLFDGIYRTLLEEIRSEQYPVGTLLPSESELTRRFCCSRTTVRKALALLASNGYTQSLVGKGVRVIWQPSQEGAFAPGSLESVNEFARRIGKSVRTKAIAYERVVCDEALSERTQFDVGDELLYVSLVRYFDDKPALLDDHYFLSSQVPGLTKEVAEHSIFKYLEDVLHARIAVSKRTITVEKASKSDKAALEVRGTVFLACTYSLTYNSDGIMFEYVWGRYLPEYFCFHDVATRPLMGGW